ncbi:hypothetical protein IV38_GL001362 [Lactobacillus selangorensis]|uniref:Gram-positive cocci surface proteins LPxTG domain-containing protein n=1 Tax=Lactobacillus selangorensis TaxID=81857 RepID=A0A0R2FUB6_9LACO|nr:BspA family leucine-rich repeat surface protein [Lactobacillus selangorensis]KRN28363.1 hypothetical protein IV38_GL001362 [Lactobacillus selangorensis]KRN31864.1 hypothetical protein IV40_GL001149 [Lactobacillus selangorensis]
MKKGLRVQTQPKTHFKMYKAKKQWLVAGITLFSLGIAGTMTSHSVHAARATAAVESVQPEPGTSSAAASSSASSQASSSVANSAQSSVASSSIRSGTNSNSVQAATTSSAIASQASLSVASSHNASSAALSSTASSSTTSDSQTASSTAQSVSAASSAASLSADSSATSNSSSAVSVDTDQLSVASSDDETNLSSAASVASSDVATSSAVAVSATSQTVSSAATAPTSLAADSSVSSAYVQQGSDGAVNWGLDSAGTLHFYSTAADAEMGTTQTWRKYQNSVKSIIFENRILMPVDCSKLFTNLYYLVTIVNGTNMDTSQTTNMSGMFSSNRNLTTLDVSNLDTSNVTTMVNMFAYDDNLANLDVSNFKTGNVTDLSGMFSLGEGSTAHLTTVDVSNWDTSKVTNMSYLFNYQYALTSLAVGNWNTSNVTTMSHMFNNCRKLNGLDVSHWDTANTTDMSNLFSNASGLTALDVSSWKTDKVTTFAFLFSGCSQLTFLDVSQWQTGNVTNMSDTFAYDGKITSLDVSHWNTSNVTIMADLFQKMSGIKFLDVSQWQTSHVTDMTNLFWACTNLQQLDVSQWQTGAVTTLKNTFASLYALTYLDVSRWDVSNVTSLYNTFSSCNNMTALDVAQWNIGKVTTMEATFSGMTTLISLDLTNWDTSNVTTMRYTFSGDWKLQYLNVSKWNVGKVTSMQNTFDSNSSLTSLDVSHWDTSSVTTMTYMFYGCKNLTYLDVSHWDISHVTGTGLTSMFQGASSLDGLDVSQWDISNVTSLWKIFDSADSLTYLDVSKWNTSNVTDMSNAFSGSYGKVATLKQLDISKWDTSHVTSMDSMFARRPIAYLDVSQWKMGNVSTIASMFENDTILDNLDVSKWDTSNVTTMNTTFYGSGLTSIDVSKWNTSKVTDLGATFGNMKKITALNLSTWDTSRVTNMANTFSAMSKVTTLDLSTWDTSHVTNMFEMFFGSNFVSLNLRNFDMSAIIVNAMYNNGIFSMLSHDSALRQLTLGPKTKLTMTANGITNTAMIDNLPKNNFWMNVGTGTVQNPEGIRAFSSTDLMADYDGATMADTYVVAPVRETITVNYIDDTENKTLTNAETTLTGGYGEKVAADDIAKVDTTIQHLLDNGYRLVVNNKNPLTAGMTYPDGGAAYTVHFAHATEKGTDTKTIISTIHYVMSDGSPAPTDKIQTLTFTRPQTTDQVTGEITYGNWNAASAIFAAVTSPVKTSYTADQLKVPAVTVTPDSENLTTTVTYTPIYTTVSVSFVDDTENGKNIMSTSVNGHDGTPISTNLNAMLSQLEGMGYELKGANPLENLTAYPNADVSYTIHLVHGTAAATDNLTKDVTSTIHYVVADDKTTAPADNVQTIHFTRTGTTDLVTGKTTYTDWTTANNTFADVTTPILEGYKADQSLVKGQMVTGNSDNVTTTVTYTSDMTKVTISYLDDDTHETIFTTTLNGVQGSKMDGQMVDTFIRSLTSQGYQLADGSGNPITTDMTFPSDAINYEVHFTHQLKTTAEAKNVTSTIHYVVDGKATAPADNVQTITFTRTGTTDLVTGKTTYTDWTTANDTFAAVTTPILEGYRADQSVVSGRTVTAASDNRTTTVTYTSDMATINVAFVDDTDQSTIMSTSLSGVQGSKVSDETIASMINGLVGMGYQLADGSGNPITDGMTFPDSNTSYTVHFTHQQLAQTDETHAVTSTVHYVMSDGAKAPADNVQTITFTRTVTKDVVTGKLTYGDWTTDEATFNDVISPVLTGYTADQANVNGQTVSGESADLATTVTYAPLYTTVSVNFVDDTTGKNMMSTTVKGHDGTPISTNLNKLLSQFESMGYQLSGQNPLDGLTTYPDTDANYTVHLVHQTQATDETKNVTSTVHYVVDGKATAPADNVQTLMFTRTGTKDLVTGKITYTDWTAANNTFADVQSPILEGYQPDQSLVKGQTVTADSDNLTTTVTYKSEMATIHVDFVDDTNQTTIVSTSLTGVQGSKVSDETIASMINGLVGMGYQLADGSGNPITAGMTFPTGNANYTVHFTHQQIAQAAETHDVTSTVHYVMSDGTQAPADNVQTITFTRTVTKDAITGKLTYGAWTATDTQFKAVDSPAITGYTPNQTTVAGQTITETSGNIAATVTYTKDSSEPTTEPTGQPTTAPTQAPTQEPTSQPTTAPTQAPTSQPTTAPTQETTSQPTTAPTQAPTQEPTSQSTTAPTPAPTQEPTAAPATGSQNRTENTVVPVGKAQVVQGQQVKSLPMTGTSKADASKDAATENALPLTGEATSHAAETTGLAALGFAILGLFGITGTDRKHKRRN